MRSVEDDEGEGDSADHAEDETGKVSENKLNIFKKKSYFIFLEFIQVHLIQQKFWTEISDKKLWQIQRKRFQICTKILIQLSI